MNIHFEKDTNNKIFVSLCQSMILIQMNIRIYSYQCNDTNKYPNIFIWKRYEYNKNEYLYRKIIHNFSNIWQSAPTFIQRNSFCFDFTNPGSYNHSFHLSCQRNPSNNKFTISLCQCYCRTVLNYFNRWHPLDRVTLSKHLAQ